jgi:hypothetical protein
VDDIVEGVCRVMQKTPEKRNEEDGFTPKITLREGLRAFA